MITVQGKGGTTHSAIAKYTKWIEKYVQSVDKDGHYVGDNWTLQLKLKGHCYSACEEMQKKFPELILIRGHVVTGTWWKIFGGDPDQYLDPGNGHFWLETKQGEIVDPTRGQFHTPEDTLYLAFDESKSNTLPTGKCPNCGDYCYGGKDLCSDECLKSYTAYIARECRF